MSEKPPAWAQELLDGQQKQSDRLEQHGEQLDEQGGRLEDINATVSDLKGQTEVNFGVIGTQFEHLKERAKEDREDMHKTEVELEGKVGKAHEKNQQTDAELGKLRGEVDNHIADEHATTTAHTAEKLNAHIDDNNRHGGEAPGKNGTAKTVGIVGGVGGGLLIIVEIIRQYLTGS